MIMDKKNKIDIFHPKQKLKDADIPKKIGPLKLCVKAILNGMLDGLLAAPNDDALFILGEFTSSFEFAPRDYLFNFEIKKIRFTYFG